MLESNKPHALMFHHFHSVKHIRGQGSIDGTEFRNIIEYYSKTHNVISADIYLERFYSQTLKENDVCITFDDNLRCQYDIALPLLNSLKLKAFWFIYSLPLKGRFDKLETYRNFRSSKFNSFHEFYDAFFTELQVHEKYKFIFEALINFNHDNYLNEFSFYSKEDKIFRYTRDNLLGEKNYFEVMDLLLKKFNFSLTPELHKSLWMNSEDIKKLSSEGHVIGLHSHTHPTKMGEKNYAFQYENYKKNKTVLESIIKDTVKSMSHPCNSYNDDTIKIMKKLGIQIGFRSNLSVGFNSDYEIPRIDHSEILKIIKNY